MTSASGDAECSCEYSMAARTATWSSRWSCRGSISCKASEYEPSNINPYAWSTHQKTVRLLQATNSALCKGKILKTFHEDNKSSNTAHASQGPTMRSNYLSSNHAKPLQRNVLLYNSSVTLCSLKPYSMPTEETTYQKKENSNVRVGKSRIPLTCQNRRIGSRGRLRRR